jgi:uncharacterized coiled-coil protein SlyX
VIDLSEARINNLESRVAVLEANFQTMIKSMDELKSSFDSLRVAVEKTSTQLAKYQSLTPIISVLTFLLGLLIGVKFI